MISFSKQLKKNLIKIGVKKKDTVYLGVNLGQAFKDYKDEIFQNKSLKDLKEECSKMILDTIIECVGNQGTIICPTFTFEFPKTKIFNIKKSKSDLGYFENFFLRQNNIVRSAHPVFSIAVLGNKKEIIKPCGSFSFGMNSPFGNFMKYNVKFLNIGIKWIDTCTYLHHVEHLNGINHRFYKPIKGKIIFNNKKSKTDIFYNPVRFMRLKSKKAEYKIEKYLKKNFIIKDINDKIYCSCIKTKNIHDLVLKILQKKPSYFMSKNIVVSIDNKDQLSFDEF
jgi:aminoglycoside 3-N-acetyltransferase